MTTTVPRSDLDELMTRWFDDDEPGDWQTGWWPGVCSVFLGAIGLGAALTLHYPSWLTSETFRALYPMGLMRGAIDLTIGLSVLTGAASLLLRRTKTLGITGLSLSVAAALLGGGRTPIGEVADTPWYLGFDWFLLNLLLLSLVFVPLERAFAKRGEQSTFRAGWTTDVIYVFVSHASIQALTFVSLLPATVVGEHVVWAPLRQAVAAQPLVVQVAEIMVLADLLQYAVHRAFHAVPFLWRFHAIHHSNRELDWLAGSRLHLVDVILTRALVFAPFFALGFSELALGIWLGLVSLHGQLNHANVRFRFRFLERFLVTPRCHHWHHATAPHDVNFALHFPWIDRLFGTLHLPDDGAWPEETGVDGHPVPEGYLAQLVHPLDGRFR